MAAHNHNRGFTLIELSIVLVIIGLIVGGVLVGQNLIAAAGVRATVTQIEKYNTAANTFREKYGYLPGDIPSTVAGQFGFAARGSIRGEGDGNGIIEAGGIGGNGVGGWYGYSGLGGGAGEPIMFWEDLSTVNLIDGGFTAATCCTKASTTAVISQYLPQAKLGGGNYVYVYSGGWGDNTGAASNGVNYFGISAVSALNISGICACLFSSAALTVQQAYNIDSKIDDGLPMTGNVLGAYLSSNNWVWPGTAFYNVAPPASAIMASNSTCFDNGNNASNAMHYSIEVSNGANVTCGVTIKMQAGD